MKENTIKKDTNEAAVIGLLSLSMELLTQSGFPARKLSATGSDCMRALMAKDVDSQLSFRKAVEELGYTACQADNICHTCEASYASLGDGSCVARTPAQSLKALSQEIVEGAARLQAKI